MNFSNMNIPAPVMSLLQTLREHSFEGWIVGGAIRTMLLDQQPKDWDITTNATPDQVQKIFDHTIETGVAYGTVTVVIDSMNMQVTTFRKESEYENHRKPKEVEYCQSIHDDLSRRDFSINAIAYDPISGKIEDPFQGVDDVNHQWIRAVGDPMVRFQEDALRILRALRFQSQLGFMIDEETSKAMIQSSRLLLSLSKERIQEEFSKWILGNHFSMTRALAENLNFFQILEAPPDRGFYDHWDLIGAIEPTLLFRLSAWLDVYLASYSVSEKASNSLKLLKSLKYPQSTISKVIQFIEFLNLPFDVEIRDQRLSFIKRSLDIGFEQSILLLDWKLQQTGSKSLLLKEKNYIQELMKQSFETKVRPLAIDGNQIMSLLGLSPGPQIKVILGELEDWVLDHPNANSYERLLEQIQNKK